MARLTLLDSKRHTPNAPLPAARHRGSATEGESVQKLLESNGFVMRRKSNSQLEFSCPFHEESGVRTKSTNFYVNATTGLYTCHSAACGERGNLQSLERYFGVDQDDTWRQQYLSREQKLTDYEMCLTPALRQPFYDRGLTDQTIERFRLGWDQEKQRYVIPYLEGRRPRYFRYYQPNGDPKYKYTWEEGATASLFNFQDAMGDKDGVVLLTEGEGKAMLLVQMGYAAVAVPGAGQWKDEFQAAFTHARKIFLVYDNDNPLFHVYDRDEHRCNKCERAGLPACKGHNPGQEAAVARVEQIGWRAKNVVLPLPDEGLKKTDVNDYFMRDGNSNADFAELVTGKRATPYKVSTLAEISASPPEEAHFLIEQGILPKSGRLLIAGKPKVGKGAPLIHRLLTPYGWTTMGAIRPGDEVVGEDGLPAKVLQIHPLGVQPIYRVTMSDGSSTLCTAEHLWTIQTHNDREYAKKDGRPRWRTMDALAIKALLDEGRKRDTYIPMVAPVEFRSREPLPLDPYALGLLLGDGSFSESITFAKPDLQLHEHLRATFGDEHCAWGKAELLTTRFRVGSGLPWALTQLGLRDSRSWNKHIPEPYLRASIKDRLAILQGLLDTDGWVQWNASHKNSSAYFGTSSERLKDHVVELVESLGGTTRVLQKRAPKFQDGGVGRPAWTVRVRLPEEFEPFRLTRKLEEWRSGRTSKETEPTRKIVSVEYSHDEEAQCITVDRPDGLYVTERFIVTHNSIFVDNLALSLAAGIPFLGRFGVDHPTRTLLLDRELSKWSLFQRLQQLSADRPGYRAAAENLLVDHDHLLRLDQPNAYDTLASLVEQNGAEVVILDTAYKFLGGDVESSSALMKAFAVLDKVLHETGVSIVMTHHLKKGQGGRGKENTDVADPDAVAGSFLWTGWPNATILLNYLNRSVENPFNSVCTFTAFRDHAAPEPLALYRDRTSISYSAVQDFSHDEVQAAAAATSVTQEKLSTAGLAQLLLDITPCTEEEMYRAAAARFGMSENSIRPFYLDALSEGHFERTTGRPPVIKLAGQDEVESWEKEHGLAERPMPQISLDLDELA